MKEIWREFKGLWEDGLGLTVIIFLGIGILAWVCSMADSLVPFYCVMTLVILIALIKDIYKLLKKIMRRFEHKSKRKRNAGNYKENLKSQGESDELGSQDPPFSPEEITKIANELADDIEMGLYDSDTPSLAQETLRVELERNPKIAIELHKILESRGFFSEPDKERE